MKKVFISFGRALLGIIVSPIIIIIGTLVGFITGIIAGLDVIITMLEEIITGKKFS